VCLTLQRKLKKLEVFTVPYKTNSLSVFWWVSFHPVSHTTDSTLKMLVVLIVCYKI